MSFTDREGVEHSVQVVATTRNEAAIRALAQFQRTRNGEFVSMHGPFRTDKLTVRIVSEESHQVTVARAQDWLEAHGSPAEMALRHRLKQLFPAAEDMRRRKSHRR